MRAASGRRPRTFSMQNLLSFRAATYSNEFAGEIDPIQFKVPISADSHSRGEWDANGKL